MNTGFKRSWKPQVRSYILNQYWFWGIITIIASILFFGLSLNKYIPSHWLYLLIICIFIFIAVERNVWKVDGYEKIIIDAGNKCVIFDNKRVVPFNEIISISVIRENNRETPLLFRERLLNNGRLHLFKVNVTLVFNLRYNQTVEFAVQNRFAFYGITNFMKKCGLNLYLTDHRNIDFTSILYVLLYVIVPVVVFLLLFFYYCHGNIGLFWNNLLKSTH